MDKTSLLLNIIGAVIGSAAAFWYGIRIFLNKEKANLATWLIVFFLDLVGLYLAFATGNDEAYIQIGWCAAATVILIATWYRKGAWVWSSTETWVLLVCIASVVIWLSSNAVVMSLLGYIMAAFLSVVPQAKDYWKNPAVAKKSAWLWQVSIVAICFSIAAKAVLGKYGFEHMFVYYALLWLNVMMTWLCMRK
jgi:hypothetical protein